MKLSIIIPTYNRKNTLKATLMSLGSQISKDFEVIIADDGSTDGTKEMVEDLKVPYPIKHVWQKNAGRSAARNMGLETAQGEIILFIDDHIIVDKNMVLEHIKYHEKYDVGVIRGRVEFIEKAGDAPKETKYVDENKYTPPRWEQQPFRVFITNNISVKKDALLSVFGFDEDFKEYGLQDAEMGYRLKEAGYKFKINPNAVGYIFGVGWTYEERLKRRRQVGRSSVLFYKKHPSFIVKINLSVHWLTLAMLKIISLFEKHLPKKMLMFYNLASGIKEGLEKYKDPSFKKMHSRFKANRTSVLFVSHLSDFSGAPISLSLLVKYLDKEKYHPVVALPSGGAIVQRLDQAHIAHQLYKDSLIHKMFPSLKIYKILKERQIDVLYINTSVSIWAAKAARRLKIPVISHIREDLRGLNNTVIRAKITRWSDKIILISNWMKSFIPSNKVIVVHNGIELDEPIKTDKQKIIKEFNVVRGPLISFIGTLEERKGIKYLIQAFPKLKTSFPFIKLLIVGNTLPGQSSYLKKLKGLTKDPNMRFIGSRNDVFDIMVASDLIIIPSISEAFGRVILEAMACGKPVIATNVGGIPEIVENGGTGILIKPASLDTIAKETTLLLKNKNEMRELGLAGRKRAEQYFNIKDKVKEIEEIIDESVKN